MFAALGLLLGQILGMESLLGNDKFWNCLLAFPFAPAFLSGIAYLTFIYKRTMIPNISTNSSVESGNESQQANESARGLF